MSDRILGKLSMNINTNTIRANKSLSTKSFIPKEYVDEDDIEKINKIVNYIKHYQIGIGKAIFYIALKIAADNGFIPYLSFNELIEFDFSEVDQMFKDEFIKWRKTVRIRKEETSYDGLYSMHIPNRRDILGAIYQSLMTEGRKSVSGSYYTPRDEVYKIVKEYVRKNDKVMDPCCGTGQFILAYSDIIDPSNIYGYDCDPFAVQICRFNLLLKFPYQYFELHIYVRNFLCNNQDDIPCDFDFIGTNPPWGYHFTLDEQKQIRNNIVEIKSFESFSLFLVQSIKKLNENGRLSFLLPESILNIKVHRGIRKFLLDNIKIEKITCLERIFQNVFTPVVRMDIKKTKSVDFCDIVKKGDIYKIFQNQFLKNEDYVFDILTKERDIELLNKIYSIKHITLKNKAEWALGIVTGNNEKYILNEKVDGSEKVYRGKNVVQFGLTDSDEYIVWEPENFQQIAPLSKYRSEEKLIYKFISKNLIFAYDNKKRLTLNSANILIPKIKEYPLKVILALFNSPVYQFIFQKKFRAIKVLRNHLESMPLPLWDKSDFEIIISYVDRILEGNDLREDLYNFIMKKFNLNDREIQLLNL